MVKYFYLPSRLQEPHMREARQHGACCSLPAGAHATGVEGSSKALLSLKF